MTKLAASTAYTATSPSSRPDGGSASLTGRPQHGIRQFVVGTGGADLLGFAADKPNSQVRIGNARGVLELVLHPAGYDWRFVSEDGAVLDKGGSVSCH